MLQKQMMVFQAICPFQMVHQWRKKKRISLTKRLHRLSRLRLKVINPLGQVKRINGTP